MTEAGCLAVEPEAVRLVMREVVEEGEEAVEGFERPMPRTGRLMGLGRPVVVLQV